jgi:hypothetical protein
VRCSGRRRKCGCVGVVGVGWGGGGLALERSGGARLWGCDRGRGLCVGERTRGRTMEVQREGGGVLVMLVVVVMGSHDPNVTPCHSHVTPCHTYFKTYLAKTTTLSRNIRHNICGEATPHDHDAARPRVRRPLRRHQCGRLGTTAAQPTCACVAMRSFRLRNDWSDRGARCCAIRVENKSA